MFLREFELLNAQASKALEWVQYDKDGMINII